MANLRIIPRNFHDEATLTTQFSPVLGYSIDNTKDTQRSRVWRTPDGTNQYINGTFADGLTRAPGFFGFFRHRCHGGFVRLQLYSDAAWTTQVYDSGSTSVINLVPTEGLDWGIDPYGSGRIDPFLTDAPYRLWFTPTGCRSYKITFSGNVSTYGYSYWQVCRFCLGPSKELPYTALYDYPLNLVDQPERNRSRGGSLRTNVGPNWRTMTLDIKRVPETEGADWLDIVKYVGTGRDFVVSLFPSDGTRKERDHVMNCKFSVLDPLIRWHPSFLSKRLQLEEV